MEKNKNPLSVWIKLALDLFLVCCAKFDENYGMPILPEGLPYDIVTVY